MRLAEFESAETVLKVFDQMKRQCRERAQQLREQADAEEKAAKLKEKEKNEYLREFVISELLRRNLSCCAYCGTITNQVSLYSVGPSIWRLCTTCEDQDWEYRIKVIDVRQILQKNPEQIKALRPIAADVAFRQLKALAEQEEPATHEEGQEFRYRFVD
jgi:hypothetical protein